MKRLIVIGGPTASGKTALAIRIAQHFSTEILSADSRQFYREMSIGTAKPAPADLAMVPHHFIDSLNLTDAYSVGDFERDALAVLDKIFLHHDVAVMTGGSGLFIQAVCAGLDAFPDVDPAVRLSIQQGERTGGLEWMQHELGRLDPVYFGMVDRQNPARVRRALEVSASAGQPYSSFLTKEKAKRHFEPVYIRLEMARAELYDRIHIRVDDMIRNGLEAEAKSMLPYRHLPALKTVGYEEFFDFFDGKITREEAIDKIKQHTRNYAKRQETWFRKHGNWVPFHPADSDAIISWLHSTA